MTFAATHFFGKQIDKLTNGRLFKWNDAFTRFSVNLQVQLLREPEVYVVRGDKEG